MWPPVRGLALSVLGLGDRNRKGQDCDGSRSEHCGADRLLIRPLAEARPGPAATDGQISPKTPTQRVGSVHLWVTSIATGSQPEHQTRRPHDGDAQHQSNRHTPTPGTQR